MGDSEEATSEEATSEEEAEEGEKEEADEEITIKGPSKAMQADSSDEGESFMSSRAITPHAPTQTGSSDEEESQEEDEEDDEEESDADYDDEASEYEEVLPADTLVVNMLHP